MYDDLNVPGKNIVGGETHVHVKLVAPNGNIQSSEWTENPQIWAKEKISEYKFQVTGDGKTLNDHPELFNQIYGKNAFDEKNWQIRIFN